MDSVFKQKFVLTPAQEKAVEEARDILDGKFNIQEVSLDMIDDPNDDGGLVDVLVNDTLYWKGYTV